MNTNAQPDLNQRKLGFPGGTDILQRVQAWAASIRSLGSLRLVLALGLLSGLLSFLIIPPWTHNDEPGHFEYVWLAAHSPTWPQPGQYDQPMRKELAASLLQYGWYAIRNMKPDLNSNRPIYIGAAQLGDKPGYYFLASLPLRLMPHAPIIAQYFAARSVSLLLYLLILVCVWYGLGEILPGDHPLRWITAIFVALLPAFADEMSSVNNDVSAVLAATLFLWASLRLIQKGISVRRLLFLLAALGACYLSKNTAMFAFLLAPLALLLAVLRGRFTGWVWGVLAALLIVLAALLLRWGGPLAWYRTVQGQYPVRLVRKDTPLGSYAFQLDDSRTKGVVQLAQVMPQDEVRPLIGQTMTIGAWIWADQPTKTVPLYVQFFKGRSGIAYSSHRPIAVGTTPAFHSVTFVVPPDVDHATIRISQAGHGLIHNYVFFDGLVLVQGAFAGSSPSFSDASGVSGTWNGQKFVNLVRNASAEQASVQIRSLPGESQVVSILSRSATVNPYLFLATIQDWKGTGRYYLGVAGVLFRTFWASLAGDKAFLRSPSVSGFLQLLTVVGVAGVPVWVWRRRRNLRWDLIGFLGVALVLPWLVVLLRGASTFMSNLLVLPWARYAFPGILPTALFLCVGWLAWLEILAKHLSPDIGTVRGVFLSIMMGISAFAFLNAIQVLHRQWWDGIVSLLLLFLLQYVIFQWIARVRVQRGWQPPSNSAGGA